jgi:hypothetical protein
VEIEEIENQGAHYAEEHFLMETVSGSCQSGFYCLKIREAA